MIIAFALPVLIGAGRFSARKAEGQNPAGTALTGEISLYFDGEDRTESIDFEEYIKGVVAAEMPASFEKEALKAQAVAARTYALYKIRNLADNPSGAPPQHPDAALCTSFAHCSAYYSPEQLEKTKGEKWMKESYKKIEECVEETRGEILVYNDEPILAVFHSASAGGHTASSGDVWQKELPYLVSAPTAGEERKKDYFTTVAIPRGEFAFKIKAQSERAVFPEDTAQWIGNITRTGGNYVKTVEIGGVEFKGTQIRSIFGLKSACFDVAVDGDNVSFFVSGNGHGVGMSQYGADYMAKNGADYTEILKNYYRGAAIAKY